MLRTALLILSGNAFGAILLLIRNLVVARLVSVEDYGIASTFAISMGVIEMVSSIGLQQLMVQDKDGDNPDLQASLHGLNFLRSFISAALLFMIAHPMAQFFGVPDLAWAYQLMALIPIIRALEHMDIHRMNRDMNFKPLVVTRVLPTFISLASIWPVYTLYPDYRVMLVAIFVQWGLSIPISHLVAHRAFRMRFDRKIMLRALKFGWPLLVNNLFMFLTFQGDKLISGHILGLEALGLIVVGTTLTLTPSLMVAATEQQFFLPQLSAAQEKTKEFSNLALSSMQASLCSGLAILFVIVLFGETLTYLLFGEKYAGVVYILPWMALLYCFRSFKIGVVTAALSVAQTSNEMIANFFRICLIPVAFIVLQKTGEMVHVIWISSLGELVAYGVSVFVLGSLSRVDLKEMIYPWVFTFLALALLVIRLTLGEVEWWENGILVFGISLCLGLALLGMKQLREYLGGRVGRA